MRKNRIQIFYKEMYDFILNNKISDTIFNTYPDSFDGLADSYVIVELPYSHRNIDISTFDVKTSFARFTFFAKDKVYKTARMPNIVEIERMTDSILELLPFTGSNYSLMIPRTVIPPKKANSQYHYAVINVPILFD